MKKDFSLKKKEKERETWKSEKLSFVMFGAWLLILTPNENKEITTKKKNPWHTNTSLSQTLTKYEMLFCNSSESRHFIHPSLDDELPQTPAQHSLFVLSQTHLSPLPGMCPFPATGLGFLTGITTGSPGNKEL